MKKKIDDGYAHEALDRTHIIICNIEDHLLEHKGVPKEAKALIKDAQMTLARAYQIIGASAD